MFNLKPMAGKNYNRLKIVLAEKNRTNKWLADRINKNQATVSQWCTNKSQPKVETLYEIAKELDIDVRELLTPSK